MSLDGDRTRRILLLGSLVVTVLAAGAVGAWALWFRGGDDATKNVGKPSYEHAQPTSATASVEPTAEPAETESSDTENADPAADVPAGAAPPVAKVKPAARAPYIAYRLAGRIVVARENGSSPKTVAASPSGVFSLSPDARTLALVDSLTGRLQLVDVERSTTVTVGPAAQVTPVWSPDSKRLLFVREASNHRQDVYEVPRSGAGATSVGAASRTAYSPDGRVVALAASAVASPFDPREVVLLRDGKPWRRLVAPGPVTDVALGADRAYVAVIRSVDAKGQQTEGVWALPFDTKIKAVRVVGSGPEDDRGVLGMLCLSPDTLHLSYARAGDDGYSRMAIVAANGGLPVSVSARKDAYPMCWSADSSAAFFIEGNAWQGEPTALAKVRPDGGGKAVLVAGAGR